MITTSVIKELSKKYVTQQDPYFSSLEKIIQELIKSNLTKTNNFLEYLLQYLLCKYTYGMTSS